jgi:hypothetical protein
MIDWMKSHEVLILWMTVASIISFVGTLIAVPLLIVRIPSHYFSHGKRVDKMWAHRHPVIRLILITGKNLIGYILVLAGLVMLGLPGQGMLTILIGIMFIDMPGKYRFEKWIVTRPPVLKSINWLRMRAQRAPLVIEE